MIYIPNTKNLITLAEILPKDTVLTRNNTATRNYYALRKRKFCLLK
ncbi:hypothetical protein OROMI_021024 [Orobanche minor]